MSYYLIPKTGISIYEEREALEQALALGDGEGRYLIQGEPLDFAVDTKPRVTIGGPAPVVEAAKDRHLQPLTPAFLESVTAHLLPGDSVPTAEIARALKAPVEEVSRALGQLKAQGKATVSGRGRGARWSSVAVGSVANV